MDRLREGRLAAARARILQELERGPLEICNPKRPGKLGGFHIWAAANELVFAGKIIVTFEGRERIVKGPRPHAKFRATKMLAKRETDVI